MGAKRIGAVLQKGDAMFEKIKNLFGKSAADDGMDSLGTELGRSGAADSDAEALPMPKGALQTAQKLAKAKKWFLLNALGSVAIRSTAKFKVNLTKLNAAAPRVNMCKALNCGRVVIWVSRPMRC